MNQHAPESAPPRFAPLDREACAGLSGREILERMIAGAFPAPPMAGTLGFRLVEVGDGRAVFEGDPTESLLNPMGTVHGGWALTLIDSATACAGQTLLPPGAGYTTVETKANFCRAILPSTGRVRCEAWVVSPGKQIVTCESRVTGPDGKVLAHGTSTLMVLAPR